MICGLHSISVGLSYSKKTSASSPDAITDARLLLLLKTTVKLNKMYEAVLFRPPSNWQCSSVIPEKGTHILSLIKPWLSVQEPFFCFRAGEKHQAEGASH